MIISPGGPDLWGPEAETNVEAQIRIVGILYPCNYTTLLPGKLCIQCLYYISSNLSNTDVDL